MNIVLILSHSIEEYDQIKLLSGMGHNVFSLGGYIDPRAPHDPKRPALPDADFPERAGLQAVVDGQLLADNIGAAAERIPDEILEWADVVVCHHYLERIFGQWPRLKEWGGRVVWRTVGQSTEANELRAQPFRADGLEIVRYSPKEKNIPGYAGEDTMIRFYKDAEEWSGWTGIPPTHEEPFIANITQELLQRDPWTNAGFYQRATSGLNAWPAGPGSEALPGGQGLLSYDGMRQYLRDARAYIYTGTQPASYTLGFIEAMMTGVPVLSIGPAWMTVFPYGHELYEGHELAGIASDNPDFIGRLLHDLLLDLPRAQQIAAAQRDFALRTFGREPVAEAWADFLGA